MRRSLRAIVQLESAPILSLIGDSQQEAGQIILQPLAALQQQSASSLSGPELLLGFQQRCQPSLCTLDPQSPIYIFYCPDFGHSARNLTIDQPINPLKIRGCRWSLIKMELLAWRTLLLPFTRISSSDDHNRIYPYSSSAILKPNVDYVCQAAIIA